MATLAEAIRIYKYNLSTGMLIGLNNVLKRYQYSNYKFTPKMWDALIIGQHQRHLLHHKYVSYSRLKKDIRTVLPALPMPRPATFEDLYDIVKKSINKVKGVGPLLCYDLTLRLGYLYEDPLLPKDYVYIQAGALNGIRALSNSKNNGSLFQRKTWTNKKYHISKFQGAFPNLESIFIEDFLCVFHKELSNLSQYSIRSLQKKIKIYK